MVRYQEPIFEKSDAKLLFSMLSNKGLFKFFNSHIQPPVPFSNTTGYLKCHITVFMDKFHNIDTKEFKNHQIT